MGWMPRDECGLLYDRIAWTLGFYNMVRERLIPLPFFASIGIFGEEWRFALADRGLDSSLNLSVTVSVMNLQKTPDRKGLGFEIILS